MSEKKKAMRRRAIQLAPHEKRMLETVYLNRKIPRDQYKDRPDDLAAMVEEWNKLSARADTADEIIHYIMCRQKGGDWVTFNGNHQASPGHEELNGDEKEVLVKIYVEHILAFGQALDVLAYDENLRDFVSRDFAARTNRIIPGRRLIAVLEAWRKRGLLPLMDEVEQKQPLPEEDAGFLDISKLDDSATSSGA